MKGIIKDLLNIRGYVPSFELIFNIFLKNLKKVK